MESLNVQEYYENDNASKSHTTRRHVIKLAAVLGLVMSIFLIFYGVASARFSLLRSALILYPSLVLSYLSLKTLVGSQVAPRMPEKVYILLALVFSTVVLLIHFPTVMEFLFGLFVLMILIACLVFVILGIQLINNKNVEKQEKGIIPIKSLSNEHFVLELYKNPDRLCIKQKGILSYNTLIYRYDQLIECGIVQDGQVVTKTTSSGAISSAIIGGILLGPVGAIVGSVVGGTSHSVSTEKINSIELHIVTSDINNPNHSLQFYKSSFLSSANEHQYRSAIEQANEWNDVIKILIHQADSENKLPVLDSRLET